MSRHTEQRLEEIKQIATSEANQADDFVQQTLDYDDVSGANVAGQQSSHTAGGEHGEGIERPADHEQAGGGEQASEEGAELAGSGAVALQSADEEAANEAAPKKRPQRDKRRREERSRARR
jgi:hypothetical protein